jgi:hypothetical protein
MIEERAEPPHPVTLAAAKDFDAADFVAALRAMKVTPHIDREHEPPLSHRQAYHKTPRPHGKPAHPKTHRGGIRLDEIGDRHAKTKFRAPKKVVWAFTFSAAAYGIIRIPKLVGG